MGLTIQLPNGQSNQGAPSLSGTGSGQAPMPKLNPQAATQQLSQSANNFRPPVSTTPTTSTASIGQKLSPTRPAAPAMPPAPTAAAAQFINQAATRNHAKQLGRFRNIMFHTMAQMYPDEPASKVATTVNKAAEEYDKKLRKRLGLDLSNEEMKGIMEKYLKPAGGKKNGR